MSVGSPAAGDVPNIYDLIVNGQGYQLLRTVDTSLPFRTQRASYSFTPTFVERQNVSGAYSDNQQDFFLTLSQKDWSGGEQQRFVHLGDPDTLNRFWLGQNIDISEPGKVTITKANGTITGAAAMLSISQHPTTNTAVFTTSTNAYNVDTAGSITDWGAHGLGNSPERDAIATDDGYVYISTTAAGTVGVRRISAAGAFTTFSATGANALAFLTTANTLYGFRKATGDLIAYNTAGGVTSVFPWRWADGTAVTNATVVLRPFGNKLLLLMTTNRGSWLYQYDGGAAPTLLTQLPGGFVASDAASLFGSLAFVSGVLDGKPSIFFYSAGTVGLLWKSNWASTVAPGLTAFGSKLLFDDPGGVASLGQDVRAYDPATGAISSLFNIGSGTAYTTRMCATSNTAPAVFGLRLSGTTGPLGFLYPIASTYNSQAFVYSSLIDFDNSLTKLMRGIKVDWTAATDGNGGSIDIAYQVDSLDGSYTTLQSSAVSGTEYLLSGVSGRSISVRITLNKGTSTAGPTLKRDYVRAAPVLQSYHHDEFILDLSGRDGLDHVRLNNGSDHPLDGLAQATNLLTAIQATAPFTIVTRHGSYTGVVEPAQSELIEIRPEEYIGRIVTRGV